MPIETNITLFQPEGAGESSPRPIPRSLTFMMDMTTRSSRFILGWKWLLRDEDLRQTLMQLRGPEAEEVANFLDEVCKRYRVDHPESPPICTPFQVIRRLSSANRKHAMRLLRSLCWSWGILPASFTLHGEVETSERCPRRYGTPGEIWLGTWRSKKVVAKVTSVYASNYPRQSRSVRVVPLPQLSAPG